MTAVTTPRSTAHTVCECESHSINKDYDVWLHRVVGVACNLVRLGVGGGNPNAHVKRRLNKDFVGVFGEIINRAVC